MAVYHIYQYIIYTSISLHIDGLVQERYNSSALALELCIVFLALAHRYIHFISYVQINQFVSYTCLGSVIIIFYINEYERLYFWDYDTSNPL